MVEEAGGRARLLMCRTRVRSNQWHTREVLQDALAAMSLFEDAGEPGRALEAASLGAGFASRLGEIRLPLASGDVHPRHELTVRRQRSRRSGQPARDLLLLVPRLRPGDRTVRGGARCSQRAGDAWKTYRQLHNIADALLLAVHQDRASGAGTVAMPLRRGQARRSRARTEPLARRMPS